MSEETTVKTAESDLVNFHEHGGEALLFLIDQTIYGIPIQYITEIIGVQPITIVPKVPYYIKGVINIRGKVVPVINVRNKIALPEIEFDERTCIIVVDIEEITVGLIVDRVREVVNVKPEEICSTSEYKSINQNNYIEAIIDSNGEIKQLLNINKLIEE
jgi:purine-binding chemotaxis protein CheW